MPQTTRVLQVHICRHLLNDRRFRIRILGKPGSQTRQLNRLQSRLSRRHTAWEQARYERDFGELEKLRCVAIERLSVRVFGTINLRLVHKPGEDHLVYESTDVDVDCHEIKRDL